MAGRVTYRPGAELTEDDRRRIANARELLAHFGLDTHPDTPEPLSELGYEQRMARGRALELAVACCAASQFKGMSDPVVKIADEFDTFIWRGGLYGAV